MLLTLDKLCHEFEIDRPTLLRWTRDGVCPAPLVVDRLVRWSETSLCEWAASGCPASEPAAGFDHMRLLILIEDIANQAASMDADPIREDEGEELARRGCEIRERTAIVGAKARQLDKDIRRRRQRECAETK